MDERLQNLSKFAVGLTDVRISRHPARKDAMFIMYDKHNDQYGDAYTEESARIYKQVILKLKPDLQFVPEFEDVLSEHDQDPYVAVVTITDLPRYPRASDAILIEGVLYRISAVRPTNRNTQNVFDCLVYPDKSETDDLQIHEVHLYRNEEEITVSQANNSTVEGIIIYGGNPTEMSFDNENWEPFNVEFSTYIQTCLRIWIKDAEGTVVYKKIDHVD